MPVIEDPVGLTLDKILLATDFSEASKVATEYAQHLSKRFASALTVTHVLDLSVASYADDAVGIQIDNMRRNAISSMDQLLSALSSADVRATGQILESHNPAAAVVGLAENLSSDLIIVGTHSRHGLSKMIVGSCAEGIIRHATCPVMTVGPNVTESLKSGFAFDNILFATDLSTQPVRKAGVALKFAQDSAAKVHLCHVVKDSGKARSKGTGAQAATRADLERLVPRFTFDWCSADCVIEKGAAAPQIIDLAKKTHADLIVLGAKRSLTWFPHLVEGVVGQVLSQANCPVMTVCSR